MAALKEDDFKLSQWIPRYGDRIALINWSKQNKNKNKKNNLLDKLMEKVKNSNKRVLSEINSHDDFDQPVVK